MKASDINFGSPGNDPSTWEWSTTDKGKRYSNLHNVSVAIGHDKQLQSLVWYDSFLDRLLTGPGREWSDADDVHVAIYLEQTYQLTRVTPGMVRDVLSQRARFEPRHVVREYLQGLTWDKIPRIAEAFEDHWGAPTNETQPQDYLRAASANFFIGMVARVLRPGCKVDTMPVFEGPQGIFKSSALEVLGGQWHMVTHESLTTTDFFQAIQGKWIVEFAELDTMGRAEVTRVKSVISTRIDRYRASYGYRSQDRPRQCVFAGTCNRDDWGRDETGLRRFWPVQCGDINLITLAAARDQLFAEACALFHAKQSWWDMPASALGVQADRQADHAWRDLIEPWLVGKSEVSMLEVLTHAVKIDQAKVTRQNELDAARVLRILGWVNKVQRGGQHKKPRRVWVNSDDVTLVLP